MNRSLLLGFALFFAVVGASLLGNQPEAKAWWGWHRHYAYGGWYGAPVYGGYYYGYAAPVVVHRPLFARHHWGGWRGYYPYAGCCGYVGCYSTCGCSSCCGYVTSHSYVDGCCGTATIIESNAVPSGGQPQPAEKAPDPAADSVMPPPPAGSVMPPPPADTSLERDSTLLNVQVPGDAVVVINGYTTNSTGSDRRYVSRGLEPGRKYRFEVRADVDRGGEMISQTKVVNLEGAKVADLSFDFGAAQVARSGL